MSGFVNPFADDPDFQYLALDRKKMLEEAKPYDAKTSCWIPDHKEGYMSANITATKGDDVTVLTDKGEVRLILVCIFSINFLNYCKTIHVTNASINLSGYGSLMMKYIRVFHHNVKIVEFVCIR